MPFPLPIEPIPININTTNAIPVKISTVLPLIQHNAGVNPSGNKRERAKRASRPVPARVQRFVIWSSPSNDSMKALR